MAETNESCLPHQLYLQLFAFGVDYLEVIVHRKLSVLIVFTASFTCRGYLQSDVFSLGPIMSRHISTSHLHVLLKYVWLKHAIYKEALARILVLELLAATLSEPLCNCLPPKLYSPHGKK